DVFRRNSWSYLFEDQTLVCHFDPRQLSADRLHDFPTGEWQRAILQDLGLAVFGGVFHCNNYALGARHEVHGPAHALHHFAGDHPVRQIPSLIALHRTQNTQVNVPATDHRERSRAIEVSRAPKFSDRFFAGVDEIRILVAGDWIWSDP